MKAEQDRPTPVEPTITLMMTESEAALLRRIAGYETTIPDVLATRDSYLATNKMAVSNLLVALRDALARREIK